jgi:hypothetical protein
MHHARHPQINVPRAARGAAPTLASNEKGEHDGCAHDAEHQAPTDAGNIIALGAILGRSRTNILSQPDLAALPLGGMPGLGVRLRLGLRLRIRFRRRPRIGAKPMLLRLLVLGRDFVHGLNGVSDERRYGDERQS